MEQLATLETENLQDWDLTQIINGKEIMSPSPISRHQIIVLEICGVFIEHTRKNKLGKILIS